MRRGCWPTREVLCLSAGKGQTCFRVSTFSCRVHTALPRYSEGQSRPKHGPDLLGLLLPKSRDLSFCAKQKFMQGPAVAPWLLSSPTLLAFSGKPHFQVAPSLKERWHSRCMAGIFWFCLVLARGENASFSLRSGYRQKLGYTHTGLVLCSTIHFSKSFAMLVTPDVERASQHWPSCSHAPSTPAFHKPSRKLSS